MRKLKPAIPIALAFDLLLAAAIVAACGVRSPVDGVVTTDTVAEGDESTDETGTSTECLGGSHNHMDGDWCECDDGYAWCDGTSLDCCAV